MKIDSNYKYGIIEKDIVKLFNNFGVEFRPIFALPLEDVKVNINDSGVLFIDAMEVDYDFYMKHKVWEDEWLHEPEPKIIKIGKKWPWSKPKRYVKGGWVRTTKRIPRKFIMNNYKIIEIGD